jgi:lipopolysaccharide export system permease protein
MVLIALAALSDARTTRQGRGLSVVAAIVAVGAVRIAGFAAAGAAVRTPLALVAVYGVPILACVLALLVIFGEGRIRSFKAAVARAAALVPVPRLPLPRRA